MNKTIENLDYIYQVETDKERGLIIFKTLNATISEKLAELNPQNEHEEYLITAKLINGKTRLDVQRYDEEYKMPGRPTPGSVSIVPTITGEITEIINR